MNHTESASTRIREIEISTDQSLYPDFGFTKGVSGAFGGALGEWSIYGGGCNFPDKGPLEGGKKAFYNSVFALRETEDGGWETLNIGSLTDKVGYGASIQSTDGKALYFVGGTNGTDALRTIYKVALDNSGRPAISTLPFSLPHGWFEGAGAHHGDSLFLLGGWKAPGEPANGVLLFSLSTGKAEEIAPLPDGARIQPVSFIKDGYLYLFGGHRPASDGERPYMHRKAYRMDINGVDKVWEEIADLPALKDNGRKLLFVGSTAIYEPITKKVFVVGGVDWDIFEEAIQRGYDQGIAQQNSDEATLAKLKEAHVKYMTMQPKEYNFMRQIITFDSATNSWEVVATDDAFATAGATLIARPDTLYIIGGERKPGVRTFDGWQVILK